MSTRTMVCPRCGGAHPERDETTPEPLTCPVCETPATEDGRVYYGPERRQYLDGTRAA